MKIKKKIDHLLARTAETLDYPPEVIADVVTHAFKFMKAFIDKPTHAGLRFLHFGLIRASIRPARHHVRDLVRKILDKKDNSRVRYRLGYYWKLLDLVNNDTTRRAFKERFGYWHYK